jgi:hypothetical protein
MQLMTIDPTRPGRRRSRPRWGAVTGAALVLCFGLASCGDADAEEDATIPLSEWVDAFNAMCVDVTTQSPDLTEEEFTELSDRSLAEMRAFPSPDENADAATEVLDAIDASTDPSVDEADIEALDRRVLAAFEAIGASDECIGGPQG